MGAACLLCPHVTSLQNNLLRPTRELTNLTNFHMGPRQDELGGSPAFSSVPVNFFLSNAIEKCHLCLFSHCHVDRGCL